MKNGTPFNLGQLVKLQNFLNIGVATVLPIVAARLGKPQAVLKAFDGKGAVFARHLEPVLEQVIKSMLLLVPLKSLKFTLSARHEPSSFYKSRERLSVCDGFAKLVLPNAKPVEAGTTFEFDVSEIRTPQWENGMRDEEIEDSLNEEHFFDDSSVCAIIAEAITKQPRCEPGEFPVHNVRHILLYTRTSLVAFAGDGCEWYVNAWPRNVCTHGTGCWVLSPAK